MAIRALDLFKIGIGPSSSHTVGPMRAALNFARGLEADRLLGRVGAIKAELFGSLGATGIGHGSHKAVMLGLEGEAPESVDTASVPERLARIRETGLLRVLGCKQIRFVERTICCCIGVSRCRNTRTACASPHLARAVAPCARPCTTRSVAASWVDEAALGADRKPDATPLSYPFTTGAELLRLCRKHGLSISELMLENEKAWREEAEISARLLEIWQVMQDCVRRGCAASGVLPGGLKVRRRAAELYRQLSATGAADDPLDVMDWVNLYALAVNEENAAGGRVVTAPTNGAAGIVPAVLHNYARFCKGTDDDGVVRFLLTAAAIGILCKEIDSISGAEVGCQGEVGSACSMAAAGLCEVQGGTPEQVENAAEIAMEHNLGLTCDPIGGLVQIPCIERNAIASVKAINAARMARRGDGQHFVSFDRVLRTMRQTGADMKLKYKETARGGLAVNVVEVPVSVVEC